MTTAPLAWGFARVDLGATGQSLRAVIPHINWRDADRPMLEAALFLVQAEAADECVADLPPETVTALLAQADGGNRAALMAMLAGDEEDNVAFRLVALFADAPCRSVEAAYLKLLAMSEGLTLPHSLNLTGIFGVLPNLAWSGNTPYELQWLRENKVALQMTGAYPVIDYVDKFPRFLHHIIPADNTRLLDGAKVRLGAHIAPGTTLMPGASYINFNAGTLGPSMVEGRISSGATIGAGTDVGGGASILGVLSGGNKVPIAIGKNCLLGANSVCGIPLGDGCILDAGVTVLAGGKVAIATTEQAKIDAVNAAKLSHCGQTIFKGKDLAGLNGLHFRLDSRTGALTALRSRFEIELNAALHV